jgi:hypothetical protein
MGTGQKPPKHKPPDKNRLDTPASYKKKRNPLTDIVQNNTPLVNRIHSSLISSVRPSSLAGLTPPIKSLTPTLQESLNWSTPGSGDLTIFKKNQLNMLKQLKKNVKHVKTIKKKVKHVKTI